MPPQTFALLIAGTRSWDHYSDQASICHAYQILHSNRIPKGNIITMMYDDIAYNAKNPYPGQIFNSPNGSDVYKGVRIDYSGDDITKNNIIAVLTGNPNAVKGGSGRVLRSTADDKIFIYYCGRGSRRYLEILYSYKMLWFAHEINNLLKAMHKMEKYNELLFYVDSDQSGSIFADLLPNNISAYAITSTDTMEYSEKEYCHSEKINSICLGREFSSRWMEDVEQQVVQYKKVGTHFETVRKHVKYSTVSEYGDLSARRCYLKEYMGRKPW